MQLSTKLSLTISPNFASGFSLFTLSRLALNRKINEISMQIKRNCEVKLFASTNG
jgi:hypothetical protein